MSLFHNKIKNTLSFHVLKINDLNLEIFTMQLAQLPSANKPKRVQKKSWKHSQSLGLWHCTIQILTNLKSSYFTMKLLASVPSSTTFKMISSLFNVNCMYTIIPHKSTIRFQNPCNHQWIIQGFMKF